MGIEPTVTTPTLMFHWMIQGINSASVFISPHFYFYQPANINSFVNSAAPVAKALKCIFCNLSDLLSGFDFSHYWEWHFI